jgi:hypothetical protein
MPPSKRSVLDSGRGPFRRPERSPTAAEWNPFRFRQGTWRRSHGIHGRAVWNRVSRRQGTIQGRKGNLSVLAREPFADRLVPCPSSNGFLARTERERVHLRMDSFRRLLGIVSAPAWNRCGVRPGPWQSSKPFAPLSAGKGTASGVGAFPPPSGCRAVPAARLGAADSLGRCPGLREIGPLGLPLPSDLRAQPSRLKLTSTSGPKAQAPLAQSNGLGSR